MNKLREKRKQKGISQSRIGNALGVSQSYYARKERGEARFYLDEAIKVAKILEISIQEMSDYITSNKVGE